MDSGDLAKALFQLFDAYPRFKDQGVDVLRSGEASSPDARGALVLRGPLKMLQTVQKVTEASKATTTADRFKVLLSRCKWVAEGGLAGVLEGSIKKLQVAAAHFHSPTRQAITLARPQFPRSHAAQEGVGCREQRSEGGGSN